MARLRVRTVITGLLILSLAGVAGAALVAIGPLTMLGPLREGRDALVAGRRALLDGRVEEATASFEEARARFRTAHDRSRSGPGAIAATLPILGRTVDVLAALAEAGKGVAAGGAAISTAIEDLPGGADGLMPTDGVIPVEALSSLAASASQAEEDVAAASTALRSSPSGLLPGPVGDLRASAIGSVEGLEDVLASTRGLAIAFPEFAGAREVRRYLFFAEDPAELRGTGGIWGAYAIVRAESGRFEFSRFRPVQSLEDLPTGSVPAPNPDYLRNYGPYGAPGYWLNANMTPDLPSAARVALATWEATGRDPLDGVITADPFALRHLLAVTGAVTIPDPRIRLTADNAVATLANRAFARFPDPRRRKAVLGEAARMILDRFLGIEARAIPRLRALVRSISEGHLRIYTIDPAMESALARADVDGGLSDRGGDLVAVIVNSGAGAKVDYFAHRTIDHEVTLLPGGGAIATTEITIENRAPTSGQPRYVIGPHLGEAGDNIPLLGLYCSSDCGLVRAERDGTRVELRTGSELGYRLYRDYFTIPAGEESMLTVTTRAGSVWRDDGSSGAYHLTVVGQTTIRPTEAVVRIQAPPGMRFASWSDGISVQTDRATWSGVLGDRQELEVTLERIPLVIRLWRAVTRAL